jgi:SPOR domain
MSFGMAGVRRTTNLSVQECEMSVSGKQAAAEINLDEFECRLRSPGGEQTGAEDLLAELAWLVDSSAPLRTRSPWPSQAVSMPGQTDVEPPQPLEIATLQPVINVEPDEPTRTASVNIEAPRASKFGDAYRRDPIGVDSSTERRSGDWTLKVWALALAAGTALIAAVFAPKGGAPGQPNTPPFVASADRSTKAPQRSDETIATSSDADATRRKDITQPAAAKGVNSKEPPIELGDHASLGNAPPAANLTPTSAGAAQSTAGASSGQPVSVVNTPVVAPPFAASPARTPQLPDPKALRTVSPRPNGTQQIATATASGTNSDEAVQASDGPQPPAKPATKGAGEAPGVVQPSTHKLDLPTKLSTKPSARIVVAKTETPAPGPEADKAPATPMEPQAASEAPLVPAQRPVDPLSHAFSYIVGALGAPAAPQPVDQTAAHKSGDWAIQFAAPKSEAEAKVNVARLNAKYAAALNGTTIGVNKTLVNGETVYALRVTGLSKAEAAALCERLKGRDCFIAK